MYAIKIQIIATVLFIFSLQAKAEKAFLMCRDLFKIASYKSVAYNPSSRQIQIYTVDQSGSRLKDVVPFELREGPLLLSMLEGNTLSFRIVTSSHVHFYNYSGRSGVAYEIPWEVVIGEIKTHEDQVLVRDHISELRAVIVRPIFFNNLRMISSEQLEIQSQYPIKEINFSSDGKNLIIIQQITPNIFQEISVSLNKGSIQSRKTIYKSLFARISPFAPRFNEGLQLIVRSELENTHGD